MEKIAIHFFFSTHIFDFKDSLAEKPKYIRINTLKITKEEGEEYMHSRFSKNSPDSFANDTHIPNLLKMNKKDSKFELFKDPYILEGKLIVQDKASCFPAFILNPPLNSSVVDCCAAPGNKTSHLSQILNNSGKIFAFEKDKKRFQTLKELLSRKGCSNIEPILADFLKIDQNDAKYRKVQYVLLDPSCSGSGIIGRIDSEQAENEVASGRLESLSFFQKKILNHALKCNFVIQIT